MPYSDREDHLNSCKEYYRDHKKEANERTKKWRRDNPEKYQAIMDRKAAKRKELALTWLEEAKDIHGNRCVVCKEEKEDLLFHHVDERLKEGNIGVMAYNSSEEKFWEEIEKCVLVCPKCHAAIHNGQHPEYLKITKQPTIWETLSRVDELLSKVSTT